MKNLTDNNQLSYLKNWLVSHKPSIPQGWLLFGLATLFFCYEYFLRIQPGVMSTQLMESYAINATAFGNLFAIYYYIYTPMQLPVGILLDKYGPRILLPVAALICAIGSFLFACSHYLWIAQVGRFLVGFGSAFGFVGALKVASLYLPPNRFALLTGLTASFSMIVGMIGNNVVVILVDLLGWRFTSIFSALIGFVLAFYLRRYLKHPASQSARLPNNEPAPSFKNLILGIWHSMKSRRIWLIALIGAAMYTTISVFAELWGVPYLEQAKHFTAQESVGAISMIFLGWAIGAPLSGFLADRFIQPTKLLFNGTLISTIVIVTILYIPNLSFGLIALLLFLLGLFGSFQVLIFAMAKKNHPAHLAGSLIALINTIVMLLGCVLQPLVGILLDGFSKGNVVNGVHQYSNFDYQIALFFIPLLFLLAIFCCKKLKLIENIKT